jgi:hypothetical protein
MGVHELSTAILVAQVRLFDPPAVPPAGVLALTPEAAIKFMDQPG